MSNAQDFDKTVGQIAGAIDSDIAGQFPHPPLMLVPALTFKVRKIMEPVTDLKMMSIDQKHILAHDIQVAIVPMLFSFEIENEIIEQVTPSIEIAAFKAIEQAA